MLKNYKNVGKPSKLYAEPYTITPRYISYFFSILITFSNIGYQYSWNNKYSSSSWYILIVSTENYNVDSGILLVTKWIWLLSRIFLTWCFVNRISILKIPYGLLVRYKGWSRARGAKQSEEWRPARCPEGRALRVDQVRFFKFQIWFRQLRHTYNSVFYAAKLKLISACIFDFTLNNLLVKGQFILQAGIYELLPRASFSYDQRNTISKDTNYRSDREVKWTPSLKVSHLFPGRKLFLSHKEKSEENPMGPLDSLSILLVSMNLIWVSKTKGISSFFRISKTFITQREGGGTCALPMGSILRSFHFICLWWTRTWISKLLT